MASRMIVPNTAFQTTSRKLKRERGDSSIHLAWIRTLPCLVSGVEGRSEAAHISYAEPAYGKLGRGMGLKEEDRWTVPLCPAAHRRQHTKKEQRFWSEVGIDPCIVAMALWGCTGDTETALVILASHRTM